MPVLISRNRGQPCKKKKDQRNKQLCCMRLGRACVPVTLHVYMLIVFLLSNAVNTISRINSEQYKTVMVFASFSLVIVGIPG